jgi:Signal transduction histidine kinase involved in nitrogen fixation and metabolism regulation
MQRTVRIQIVALVGGSMIAGFLILGLIGGHILGQRLMAEKEAELGRVLTLMSRSAEGKYAPDVIRNEFSAWAGSLDQVGDYYRLSLIDQEGRLLDDSRTGLKAGGPSSTFPDDQLQTTHLSAEKGPIWGADSRARRPEVLQALREGQGVSRRYSPTEGRDYLYVATRVTLRRAPDLPALVLRLGLPQAEVRAVRNQILRRYAAFALLISLLAAASAYGLTRPLDRSIKELVSAARDLADGRLDRRLLRQPKSELAWLGLALNRLASRFSRQARRDRSDQERLLAVLENMGDGVLVTDADGNITNSNPALARLFQLKSPPSGFPGEFIRQPEFIEALSRAGRGEIIPHIQLSLASYPAQTVEVRLRPLGDEYQPEGVVSVFHKI